MDRPATTVWNPMPTATCPVDSVWTRAWGLILMDMQFPQGVRIEATQCCQCALCESELYSRLSKVTQHNQFYDNSTKTNQKTPVFCEVRDPYRSIHPRMSGTETIRSLIAGQKSWSWVVIAPDENLRLMSA